MSYLILVTVPVSQGHMVDNIIQVAASFLGTAGSFEASELGRFLRAGRSGGAEENLRAVCFEDPASTDGEAASARSLEVVLKKTLAAAGARGGDVRVFVKTE